MGILDDAIREHLDLKRRRGADPAEIERLERDAFGPLRRPGELAGAEAEDHADLADDALGQAHYDDPDPYVAELDEERPSDPHEGAIGGPIHDQAEHEEGFADEQLTQEEGFADEQLTQEHAFEPLPPEAWPEKQEPDLPAEDGAYATAEDEVYAASHAPAEPDDVLPPHGAADDQMVGDSEGTPPHPFEADSAPAAQTPGEDDLLEETPEFLQDTPEHDRLWFEQAPPRDFDFGG